MKNLRFALPGIVLVALVSLFAVGLHRDPREIPSPLVGKAAPAFDLPVVAFPKTDAPPLRLTTEDLKGKPLLVNFFASWCAGCQVEHPFLLGLAQSGAATIVGIDYKDADADLRAWLGQKGNPYAPILADLDGKAGIDWGVYGVPETFVLDASGTIVYKQIGPMTAEAWDKTIKPLLAGGKS